MVDQIREQVVEVIDSGSYEVKRQFIQACVQQIKIAGNSVTISFSVKELPASSTLLVAGAGFEPATFGREESKSRACLVLIGFLLNN